MVSVDDTPPDNESKPNNDKGPGDVRLTDDPASGHKEGNTEYLDFTSGEVTSDSDGAGIREGRPSEPRLDRIRDLDAKNLDHAPLNKIDTKTKLTEWGVRNSIDQWMAWDAFILISSPTILIATVSVATLVASPYVASAVVIVGVGSFVSTMLGSSLRLLTEPGSAARKIGDDAATLTRFSSAAAYGVAAAAGSKAPMDAANAVALIEDIALIHPTKMVQGLSKLSQGAKLVNAGKAVLHVGGHFTQTIIPFVRTLDEKPRSPDRIDPGL